MQIARKYTRVTSREHTKEYKASIKQNQQANQKGGKTMGKTLEQLIAKDQYNTKLDEIDQAIESNQGNKAALDKLRKDRHDLQMDYCIKCGKIKKEGNE